MKRDAPVLQNGANFGQLLLLFGACVPARSGSIGVPLSTGWPASSMVLTDWRSRVCTGVVLLVDLEQVWELNTSHLLSGDQRLARSALLLPTFAGMTAVASAKRTAVVRHDDDVAAVDQLEVVARRTGVAHKMPAICRQGTTRHGAKSHPTNLRAGCTVSSTAPLPASRTFSVPLQLVISLSAPVNQAKFHAMPELSGNARIFGHDLRRRQ